MISTEQRCIVCSNVVLSFHKERKNVYCSRSCANSRSHSEETKNKIRFSLRKHQFKTCEYCLKVFEFRKRARKFCSTECLRLYLNKNASEFVLYKNSCKFKFNLSDYPEEFDFSLISQFGWYKPKNRGNNMNGVSRDHIVSIKFGWENSISPEIISHPANCCLMRHNDNVSKGKKIGMSVEELKAKILEWDIKYKDMVVLV